ncbi:MAG: hypothetical protein JRJ57_02975 [Deltaproteobacteria bacterium]|nr:hypothetical protein [Deltaproteobacteria bacterium]
MSLPSSKHPRLYFSIESFVNRWRHTRLYPAFRMSAQFFRLILRIKALLCIGMISEIQSDRWLLAEFVGDVLPEVCSVVLLIGTPGPTQKITIQLWDKNQIVGYLKYATKPAAVNRLEQEYSMLTSLPKGIGPRPLKYGDFIDGIALLIAPLFGKQVQSKLPPTLEVKQLLKEMVKKEKYSVENHPWVQKLREKNAEDIDCWLLHLTNRQWQLVVNHGDFAPWNIFKCTDGRIRAIDWEYGCLEGFPYIDLTYYLLQVIALIYRWSPIKAQAYAKRFLTKEIWPGLMPDEAESIICLAAYHAYQQALPDSDKFTKPLQIWRKAIWEKAI